MSPGESYGQWELIWNSQLIGRYKEMSPGDSYGQWELIWNSQLIGRYKKCHQVNLTVNESSFETVN